MGRIINKVAGVGLGLGLAYGAVGVLDAFNKIPGCLFPNPKDCLPEGQQAPAEAAIGDMNIESEDLTGTVVTQTIGEVTMRIGGDKSVFKYDSKSHWDISGPLPFVDDDTDAWLYWNGNGKQTQSVVYNPCFKLEDDYTNITAAHPEQLSHGSNFQEPTEATNNTVDYRVDVIEEPGPDHGKIRKITIDAGFLDTCFVRVPNTPANQLIWTNSKRNQGMFGSTEAATFRWMVDELVTKYAASQSCPESVLDMAAVESTLEAAVIGRLVLKYPDHAANIGQAVKNDLVEVNILPPEARRAHYQRIFNATQDKIRGMDESFKNPRNGKRYKLEKPTLGNFAVKECAVSKPFTAQ